MSELGQGYEVGSYNPLIITSIEVVQIPVATRAKSYPDWHNYSTVAELWTDVGVD